MSSLAQLTSNLRNSNTQGRGNRGQTFTDRQLQFWIKEGRNFLVYADSKKNGYPDITLEQDLGCQTLQTVDRAECPSYVWGEDVKKLRIPNILDLPNNAGLAFFGLIDKRTRITLSDMQYGSLNDSLPFKPKNNIEAQMTGDTIYLWGPGAEKLCVVNVRIIAEDPTLVKWYDEQGIEYCYDIDKTEYPIQAHLEGILFQWIDERYINPKAGQPQSIQDNEVKQTVL